LNLPVAVAVKEALETVVMGAFVAESLRPLQLARRNAPHSIVSNFVIGVVSIEYLKCKVSWLFFLFILQQICILVIIIVSSSK
jgi:hypothetical protein